MSINDDSKIIGYFARLPNTVFCDGDACIIAGSETALKNYLSEMIPKDDSKYILKKTRFGEIMRGLNHGGAYAFDDIAYNRFYPLAKRTADAEDNLPTGVKTRFIRIMRKDIA
jgi:hypothetical protein